MMAQGVAARQAAFAQAKAEAHLAQLWKKAQNNAERLARADEARQAGEIALAGRMYARLARTRPPNESTETAKQRIGELTAEVRQKLREIEGSLQGVSPGELLSAEADTAANEQYAKRRQQITEAFEKYDQMAGDYSLLPSIAAEIKAHVAKQRKRPECAMVLDEPKAKVLWELAQQQEADGNACCAYWVYREAAGLAPAPSGRQAETRAAEMAADADMVAKAEACRQMQRCHKMYNSAEQMRVIDPRAARDLYTQIVAKTPAESQLCQAAKKRLVDLAR